MSFVNVLLIMTFAHCFQLSWVPVNGLNILANPACQSLGAMPNVLVILLQANIECVGLMALLANVADATGNKVGVANSGWLCLRLA